MIDVYAWTTPNGLKPLIALEELGLPYRIEWIDISKGAQMAPSYLAINPNNKVPAIVDTDGPGGKPITVFESGAVLLYLADKTGKLLANSGPERYTALEWMFFHVGGPAPMIGQLGYFTRFAPEKIPQAIERYTKETHRLMNVLDKRLAEVRFLAGEFSMADILNMTWPRVARGFFGLDFSGYPHLTRWLDELEARPAFSKVLALKPPG